jgi:hypothetical protein
VLTPRRIEPQKAQFINSPINLQICKNYQVPLSRFPDFCLGEWIPSISQSVETGATYSLGYAITSEATCNDIGQRYYGPKVLITDALCYSATDAFAAGFQDHGIGTVLGISENTGAGGANVWSHRLLRVLMDSVEDPEEAIESPYTPLPKGADLRVAIRRTVRVGPNAGSVVEDLGVKPDVLHFMTRDDVLNGNKDLITQATQILASQRPYSMSIAFEHREGALPILQVETRNVDWLNIIANDRPCGYRDVVNNRATIDLREVVRGESGGEVRVEIQGYEGNQLVAARRTSVARG